MFTNLKFTSYATTYKTAKYRTNSLLSLTRPYNTRRVDKQQPKTFHTFSQPNCLYSMIELINKMIIIKLHISCTSGSIKSLLISG